MSAMFDLRDRCGLDIKLDTQRPRLIFGEGLTAPEVAVRKIEEMRDVLLNAEAKEPKECYYMYRDVHRITDRGLLARNNLRYDVTVIRPEPLSSEFMKTYGHYHPGSFTELYEIVAGQALCLLQRLNPQDSRIIEDVILAEAVAGQKIVIPPFYGHILINPSKGEHLVTSNWVSSRFNSEYELYKEAKGAAYFILDSQGQAQYRKNPYFKEVAPLRRAVPAARLDKFALEENHPIYPIITQGEAKKLDFLNRPLDFDYKDVFVNIK